MCRPWLLDKLIKVLILDKFEEFYLYSINVVVMSNKSLSKKLQNLRCYVEYPHFSYD